MRNAYRAGMIVVSSAGNENVDSCLKKYAASEHTVTVGSTTSSDTKAGHSNWGTCLTIFAPGYRILAALSSSDSATGVKSGTSMVCAQGLEP